MIIENLESLKLWLIQTLTPICDADPDTLAKYVIALVKKEKPLEELKESCFRDLDVFLQDKTKAFVSRLFDALHNKSYLVIDNTKNGDSHLKNSENNISKESVKPGPKLPEAVFRSTYISSSSDREHASQDPSRLDGKLPEHRVAQKECFAESDQDYRTQNNYYGLVDSGRGLLPYSSHSAHADPNLPVYGAEVSSGELRHRRLNQYEPFHAKDTQSYRPRTSSFHRREKNSSRRDHPHFSSGNSFQDYRYQNDKPRQNSSLEKVYGAEMSTRYGSPARSLESERIGGRRGSAHPWHQRHPDARKGQAPRPLRSPISRGRSRTRSRTGSRTPSRSVDQAPASRSSHSRSRSPAAGLKSQPTTLSGRNLLRPGSPEVNDTSVKQADVDDELVSSRTSTPLEEETYKVSEPQNKMRFDGRRLMRPRCRDYDEKGFCIRGDLCEFDHGNDPVIVDSIKIPFPSARVSEPVGHMGPVPLPPPGLPLLAPLPYMSKVPFPDPQNMIPPPMPYPPPPPPPEGGAAYLPPPPILMPPMTHLRGIDLQLYPPPGPPHMCPFPMMPQPFVGSRPLPMRPEPPRNDLYQPMVLPGDTYLPEPYSPKSPSYHLLSKSSDSHDAVDSAGFSVQKLGPNQIVANRHNNLVRVPTDGTQAPIDDRSDLIVSSANHPGLKRPADALDSPSGSAASTAPPPPPQKKTAFEHPGVRHGGANNTTLELRRIPREQNTIANINDHFSKFGIIVNLQVGWESDPQAALVSFASAAQAQLAYRSQEPFLNNRFIKIFWHNAEKSSSQSQASTFPTAEAPRQRIVIPERHKLQLNNKLKNATQAAKNVKPVVQPEATKDALPSAKVASVEATVGATVPDVLATPSVDGKTPVPAATPVVAVAKSNPEAAPKGSTKLQRQSSKEIPNKTVLLKQLEVQKKLQELISKHIDQQKILFEKLEKDKSTLNAEEKANIIKTIKLLAKKIEELKSSTSSAIEPDLQTKSAVISRASTVVSPAASIPSRGSLRKVNSAVTGGTRAHGNSGKQSVPVSVVGSQASAKGPVFHDSKQAQKALLDTELDLISHQKDGSDAAELLRRVTALKEEAASLGLLGPGLGLGLKPGISHSHGRGHSLATTRGRGIVRGARRWSGGISGAAHAVDRRPKQLLITGFLTDEKEDLLSHLQVFGELDSSVFDLLVPSLSVTFKSRLHAEKAAVNGKSFNGKELKMIWQKPSSVLTERNSVDNSDLSIEKSEVKILKEVFDDTAGGKTKTNSSPVNDVPKADIVHVISDAIEKSKSDNSIKKKARLYSLTGEEEEFDEEALLDIDEEEEDDNNEGGRPWRR